MAAGNENKPAQTLVPTNAHLPDTGAPPPAAATTRGLSFGAPFHLRPLPLRVWSVRRVVNELITDSCLPRSWSLDQEIVAILVEGDDVLVEESLGTEDPLEWHLQRRVLHKRNAGLPGALRIRDERQVDVLKLNRPMTAEDTHRARFSTSPANPNTKGVCRPTVEECDRRSGVDQRAQSPIAGLPMLQPHIEGRSKYGWPPFLAVRKPPND